MPLTSPTLTAPALTSPALTPAALTRAQNPVLSGVTVSGPATVDEGLTGAYTATAVYTDASTADVTATAEWSVDGPASVVAGVLTAELVAGDTAATVTATFGGLSGEAALTVLDLAPAVILAIDGTSAWPGTVVRAGAATYVDGAGAVVEVPANTARITPAGILIEPAGENLVQDSDLLDGASWTLSLVAVSSGATASPMAGVNADGLVASADMNVHYAIANAAAFAVTPGELLWISGHMKAGAEAVQGLALVFADGGGAISAVYAAWSAGAFVASGDWYPAGNDIDAHGEQALASGWYRYSAQITVPAGSLVAIPVILPGGPGAFSGDGAAVTGYAWGVQAEQQAWPGSLVRTSGGTDTRPIDSYPHTTPAEVSTALADAWTLIVKARFGVALADMPAGWHALVSTQDQPNSALYVVSDGAGNASIIARFDVAKFAAVTLPAVAADTDFLLCVAGEVGGNIVAGYRVSGGDWTDGSSASCTAQTADDGTLYAGHTPLVPVTVSAITVVAGALDAAARNAGFDL